MAKPKKNLSNKLSEIDVVSEILKMLPQYKADYLFYLYASECLSYEPIDGTFEELKKLSVNFPQDVTERTAKRWLLEDNTQKSTKLLLAKVNARQMHELHQQYVVKAQKDHFSLRALMELNKTMFDTNDDSELTSILNNIELGADED